MATQTFKRTPTACSFARTQCHKYVVGQCVDVDAACLVGAGVRCWYFELAVLPLAARRSECEGIAWDYIEKTTGWEQRIEQPEHLRCREIRHASEWRGFLKAVSKESLWEWAPFHRYLGPLAPKGKRGKSIPTGAPTAGRPPAVGTQHPGFRTCSVCHQGYVRAAADVADVCPICLPGVEAQKGRPKRRMSKDGRLCTCGAPLARFKRVCEECRKQKRRERDRDKKRKRRKAPVACPPH